MTAPNLLDVLLDNLDKFINPNRRNLFITPEQRAILLEKIAAAEKDAYARGYNAAIDAAASKANYVYLHAEGFASDAGYDIEKEIRALTK